LELDGGEQSASHSDHFTPGERATGTHYITSLGVLAHTFI